MPSENLTTSFVAPYAYGKVFRAPANQYVNIFSVDLPTANTGCTVFTIFGYNVTNGSVGGSHSGLYAWTFCNDGGVVTGTCVDAVEATCGTGAGPGIDTETVSVVGTTATARVKFATPLNVSGVLRITVIFSTSPKLTIF